MDEILFHKKLCEHIDTLWHECYRISMPGTSGYPDYTFDVPEFLVYGKSSFLSLHKPKKEDFLFVLSKTKNREEGKRYSRVRLLWDELKAQFAEHSAQFDTSQLPHGLAYVYDYDYSSYGEERARHGRYVVGAYNDTWFWVADDDKRRRSAKNFRFIRELQNEDVELTIQQTKRLDDIEFQIGKVERTICDTIKIFACKDHEFLQDIQTTCCTLLEQKKAELLSEQTALIKLLELN